MITTMYEVSAHDTVHEIFILRTISASGRLVVRDEYHDLTCVRCKKVDELAALQRGFSSPIAVASKRPFVLSTDEFKLVD